MTRIARIEGGSIMSEIVFSDESHRIMGACFEVYNEQGCGFLESVYQECLALEFDERKVPFVEKKELQIRYKGRRLKATFKPDFFCFEKIIVELKALSTLADEHRAQVHNYLKATGYKLGLLVNFGKYTKVQYERIVR